MRYLLIILVLLFYGFFFVRAYALSRSLGKTIKAKSGLLNASILSAGLATLVFLGWLVFPEAGTYFLVLPGPLTPAGTSLIFLGLVTSTIASLSLKKSWRIGVDETEKTELITTGIYRFSRNPYFLSYDLVLLGMVLSMPSPLLAAIVLVTMTLFHLLILREERYLEKTHGETYLGYRRRVRRYL